MPLHDLVASANHQGVQLDKPIAINGFMLIELLVALSLGVLIFSSTLYGATFVLQKVGIIGTTVDRALTPSALAQCEPHVIGPYRLLRCVDNERQERLFLK